MARLIKETIEVDSNAINPTIVVRCDFEYIEGWEVPVSLNGEIRLANGKKAASLTWNRIEENLSGDLTFPDELFRNEAHGNPRQRNTIRVSLSAELSQMVIDQIEKLRDAEHEKAARFVAVLGFTSLRSETNQRSGNKSQKLVLRHETQSLYFVLNQSDWVKKFAEPLGIGKFLLMELRVLDHIDIPESWKKVFERTQQRLLEMDQAIKQGAWFTAMDRGRQVFDNLKVFDGKPAHAALVADFDAALKACNHSDAGIKDLKEGIKHLFHFGSKYVHDTGLTGVLNPATIATKEDAYLMYSIGLSILNMLGSKLHLLSIRSSTP